MIKYSETFFRSDTLQIYAKAFYRAIPKNVNCVVSTGASGSSIASGILAVSDRILTHISVAKPNESRYGGNHSGVIYITGENYFSYNIRNYLPDVVIVDDFTESGETLSRIIKFCNENIMNIKKIIVGRVGYPPTKTVIEIAKSYPIYEVTKGEYFRV